MKICGIYKITSPSNKIYIGKSIDVLRRHRQYSKLYCKPQTHLYNSFIKHGFDKHEFEILLECDKSELNDLEIYYIGLFQSFDSECGLNLRSGGEGGMRSKETKLKISIGVSKSEKSFKKGGVPWNKGKTNVFSEDTLNKMRGNKNGAGNKGRKYSEESLRRMSESKKGRIPWNKGKKTGKGGSFTSFKKGHTAWNKGIPENEETKRKRLITLKKFYENKKQLVE